MTARFSGLRPRLPHSAVILAVLLAAWSAPGAELPASKIRWERRWLWNDLNEGIAVADVNRDGKPDVIAGTRWFEGPEFKPHVLRDLRVENEEFFTSNGDHVFDVNSDGWPDVIAGSWFAHQIYWYENPGKDGLGKDQKWKEHLVAEQQHACEGILFQDIDGDSVPEIIVNSWVPERPQTIIKLTPGTQNQPPAFQVIEIGGPGTGHGAGVGDINGDGRPDLLVCKGWYEQPASGWTTTKWTFHKVFDFHHVSLPCQIVDLTGDGRSDLIVGQAHDYQLRWLEQAPANNGESTWIEHPIDNTYSQIHDLEWADLDGDGKKELITGKRWRGHKGSDPGSHEPPCLLRYLWNPDKRAFERDIISYDQGIGTGMQIRVADMDADGRPDILVAGKSGTYILFNRGPASPSK